MMLWLLLGCRPADHTDTPCDTADCRIARSVALWPDSAQAISALNLLRMDTDTSLSALEQQLAAAMQHPRTHHQQDILHEIGLHRDLWPTDGADEGSIPAIAYPGGSRRPVSSTPAQDRTLALLEAAAYVRPPRRDVLEAALDSTDPTVRWSAERLLVQSQRRRRPPPADQAP